MVGNVLTLLLRGFMTFVTYFYVGGLGLCVAILVVLAVALICHELGKAVARAFQSYRQRLMLPPTVEMTAPVPSEIRINAGGAAATDYTSLLGGGTDGPTPSGLPVERQ